MELDTDVKVSSIRAVVAKQVPLYVKNGSGLKSRRQQVCWPL
jgi:hypothetical protein